MALKKVVDILRAEEYIRFFFGDAEPIRKMLDSGAKKP
jgi:hypothetical protein